MEILTLWKYTQELYVTGAIVVMDGPFHLPTALIVEGLVYHGNDGIRSMGAGAILSDRLILIYQEVQLAWYAVNPETEDLYFLGVIK